MSRAAKVLLGLCLQLVVMNVACRRQPDSILQDMRNATDMDEFNRYAAQARRLGREGIPVLLAVLNESLDKPAVTFDYGKTSTCIQHLHDLATEGTYAIEEMPVLLRAIRRQLAIRDTLITANTLQLISGLDVGYDEAFVANYQLDDEPRLQEMLARWDDWYKDTADTGPD